MKETSQGTGYAVKSSEVQYRLKEKRRQEECQDFKLCQAIFTVDEINCTESKLMSAENSRDYSLIEDIRQISSCK